MSVTVAEALRPLKESGSQDAAARKSSLALKKPKAFKAYALPFATIKDPTSEDEGADSVK